MANSVNKVVYDGRTLIDLTSDTVVAGAMRQNYTWPPHQPLEGIRLAEGSA